MPQLVDVGRVLQCAGQVGRLAGIATFLTLRAVVGVGLRRRLRDVRQDAGEEEAGEDPDDESGDHGPDHGDHRQERVHEDQDQDRAEHGEDRRHEALQLVPEVLEEFAHPSAEIGEK